MTGWEGIWPHLAACVACAARLAPIVFLCPALGGSAAPVPVKLGVVLALTGALHVEGGLALSLASTLSGVGLAGVAAKETILGVSLGLLAALPYEAARLAGRWLDTLRGASAEASLPGSGTREAASGELLHAVTLAASLATAGWAPLLRSIWRSFVWIPLGVWSPHDGGALVVGERVAQMMEVAVAMGVPIAVATLLADAASAFAVRASEPGLLTDLGAPLRLLVGAAALWIAFPWLMERALAEVGELAGVWEQWSRSEG